MHSNNVKLKNDLKVIRFFARPASRGNLLSRGPQAQHMFEIRSFNSEHVRNYQRSHKAIKQPSDALHSVRHDRKVLHA